MSIVVTRPGRLVKFTTQLVLPQIVATSALVQLIFYSQYALRHIVFHRRNILVTFTVKGRIVSLMSECVSKVNYVVASDTIGSQSR